MEYREERQRAYVVLDLSAMLPVHEPGGFNPETVLEGYIRMTFPLGDYEMKVLDVSVAIPAMNGRQEPNTLIDRAVEIYVSEGYSLDAIQGALTQGLERVRMEQRSRQRFHEAHQNAGFDFENACVVCGGF